MGYGTKTPAYLKQNVNPQVTTLAQQREQYPPGLGQIAMGNLDLSNRIPLVEKTPEGTVIKTENSIAVGGRGEPVISVPTVINGIQFSDKEAVDYAMMTGRHLGVYDTQEHSDAAAIATHLRQARNYPNAAQIVDRSTRPLYNSKVPGLGDVQLMAREGYELAGGRFD